MLRRVPQEKVEFKSISDRVKNRNTYGERIEDDQAEIIDDNDKFSASLRDKDSTHVMINRLQSLKDQCSNIESNMDMMIEASKTMYPEVGDKKEQVRNTVHLPSTYYYQEQKNELMQPLQKIDNNFMYQQQMSDLYSGRIMDLINASLFSPKRTDEFIKTV